MICTSATWRMLEILICRRPLVCETLNKAHVVGVGIRAIHFKSLHMQHNTRTRDADRCQQANHLEQGCASGACAQSSYFEK